MPEPRPRPPLAARYTSPVCQVGKVVDVAVGDGDSRGPCPIVNPSYGKKALTRAEACELIETLARGLRVVDGH